MAHAFKLLRFLAAGIPAFLIAIPLNWLLVESFSWPKPAAYALVLFIQVIINFFACVLFVFERDTTRKLHHQFLIFLGGIMAARLLDWALYSLLVQTTTIHYTAIQLSNVVLFSLLKFAFARRTIEG